VARQFPERLHVAVVTNAPRIFAGIFALCKPFLAEDTKSKVVIVSKSGDHLAELSKLIDPSEIPTFLGGSSECAIPDGSATGNDDERPDVSETPATPSLS
jgi:hypothetical protein